MDQTMKVTIGIDPGRDGAMAVLGYRNAPVMIPFNEAEYTKMLRELGYTRDLFRMQVVRPAAGVAETEAVEHYDMFNVSCVVEHVSAMPGQGVTSCFSFGQNFGFILGLLSAYDIPYELVRPQKWKRLFSCTSDKNTSIAVAQRLFPGVDLRRTPKCQKPHDGICEALLMAEYCRRKLA